MAVPLPDVSRIEAILFDMNGTLRQREPNESIQRAADARLCELLGMKSAPEGFWEELTRRQKGYSQWANENLIQLSEAEIWTRWLLPDLPPELVAPSAADLMLAWSERKGGHIPKPGADATLMELRHRGYRLGVISNTMGTLDIPRSLNSFGWKGLFEVILLSSNLRIRKPAPEPFLEAARLLNLAPSACAYLGNRISKDIAGCKRAGYSLGMLLDTPSGLHPQDANQVVSPDIIIHSLNDLLTIFPGRGQ